MSDKVYPAIYKSEYGYTYLYQDKSNYYSHQREKWDKSTAEDNHENDKNITREYLANTYGKVESEEHAEFIIELAKVNGIKVCNKWRKCRYFNFVLDCHSNLNLCFFGLATAANKGEKQITIPIPPKCDEPLNNGDNLMFAGESQLPKMNVKTPTPEVKEPKQKRIYGVKEAQESALKGSLAITTLENLGYEFDGSKYCKVDTGERKEWPQVGDEVLAPFNRINVKATVCWQRVNDGGMHVSLVFNDDYDTFWCVTDDLQKPKTPEEELRD
jgi:hypothetical protein